MKQIKYIDRATRKVIAYTNNPTFIPNIGDFVVINGLNFIVTEKFLVLPSEELGIIINLK